MLFFLCMLIYLMVGLLVAAYVQVTEPAENKNEEVKWATIIVFIWPISIVYVLWQYVFPAPYRLCVLMWRKILKK